MRTGYIGSVVTGCLLAFISIASAQTDSAKSVLDRSTIPQLNKGDTSLTRVKPADSAEFKPKKSPMLALGLSAVIPGAGQIYTENYWKPALIWGVGGYWIYEWIQLNNKYKDFRSRYQQTKADQYQRLRDFYHDERDKFAWFLGALYALNLLDAYAGAHLYDFDVSPELTLNGQIVPKVNATVRLNF